MKLLDYNNIPSFLARYFGTKEQQTNRLVGPHREYHSDYFDIVRFFGNGGIDPKSIKINYTDEPFSFSDPLIASFSEKIADQLKSEGRIYNGPSVMKLIDVDFSVRPCVMTVQPVEYGMKAGSCFALDCKDGIWAQYGGTLREYYKSQYPGVLVRDNPLAISLGVSGLLLTKNTTGEQGILIVYRSGNLASLEHTFGPSAAGSVDWETTSSNLHELIIRSMSSEIVEELHLPDSSFEVLPLAYTREIFRGEQPHLFCLIKTDLRWEEIKTHLSTVRDGEFEQYQLMLFDQENSLSETEVSQFNHETKMNYYLMLEYLQNR